MFRDSPRSPPRRRAGARRRRGSSSARTPTRAAAPAARVERAGTRAAARPAWLAQNRCSRSGPAAARAEISTSSPRSNCAPCPTVSSHAAQPREETDPRDRRVVALRDAALVEHVGRAVGAGVAAVGAEPDRAPGLVDVQPVAGAEPRQTLLGVPRPREPEPAHRPLAGQRRSGIAAQLQDDMVGPGLGHPDLRAGLAEVERIAEFLTRDHALRPLHEVVVDLAVAHARLDRAEQPSPAAPDGHARWRAVEFDRDHRDRIGARAPIP